MEIEASNACHRFHQAGSGPPERSLATHCQILISHPPISERSFADKRKAYPYIVSGADWAEIGGSSHGLLGDKCTPNLE